MDYAPEQYYLIARPDWTLMLWPHLAHTYLASKPNRILTFLNQAFQAMKQGMKQERNSPWEQKQMLLPILLELDFL